jgi:hypothetical protein
MATFGCWPIRGPCAIVRRMSATLRSRGMSAVPPMDPRGRRRPVGWHRAATLEPKHLKLHAQLISERKPMSGRCGGYVYYWAYGRLCWRRHVVPKDPRTPAQERSRAAFRAASIAWSHDPRLSEAQRAAWRAAAAKTKCKPRLGASGFRTSQQHYVGRNSLKERWDLPMLLEPYHEVRKKDECGMQQPGVPTQAGSCQALARPSSERRRSASRPLPMQCRWPARSPGRGGSSGWLRRSAPFAQVGASARLREFWRGG